SRRRRRCGGRYMRSRGRTRKRSRRPDARVCCWRRPVRRGAQGTTVTGTCARARTLLDTEPSSQRASAPRAVCPITRWSMLYWVTWLSSTSPGLPCTISRSTSCDDSGTMAVSSPSSSCRRSAPESAISRAQASAPASVTCSTDTTRTRPPLQRARSMANWNARRAASEPSYPTSEYLTIGCLGPPSLPWSLGRRAAETKRVQGARVRYVHAYVTNPWTSCRGLHEHAASGNHNRDVLKEKADEQECAGHGSPGFRGCIGGVGAASGSLAGGGADGEVSP